MTEIWKDIPGFVGVYQASNSGRIRSLGKLLGSPSFRFRYKTVTVLKSHRDHRGYFKLILSCQEGKRSFLVHRLVLMAFAGECPEGMEGAHIDGNKENNVADNLVWKTRLENIRDKHAHGTMRHGIQIYSAKIDESKAVEAVSLARSGASKKSIASKYGVSVQIIKRVLSGHTWSRFTGILP